MPRAKGKAPEVSFRVPIEWKNVEESPLVFANSMLVQHTMHEFIITFAQVHPPITLGKTAKDLQNLPPANARAAVRVALPPTRMKELIDILAENYDNFIKRKS